MDATEARKLSENHGMTDYDSIKNSIEKAAKEGKFFCWHYETVMPQVREKLEREGFKVGQTQFDRNEALTEISW